MASGANGAAAFVQEIAAEVVRLLEERGVGKPASERRLITLKEAGQLMGGKSGGAIRYMVSSGLIPGAVVRRPSGRRIFLDKREFEKWMDAQ